ncbi:hypothetical protein KI387_029994, partial [Taxus chinensis]
MREKLWVGWSWAVLLSKELLNLQVIVANTVFSRAKDLSRIAREKGKNTVAVSCFILFQQLRIHSVLTLMNILEDGKVVRAEYLEAFIDLEAEDFKDLWKTSHEGRVVRPSLHCA